MQIDGQELESPRFCEQKIPSLEKAGKSQPASQSVGLKFEGAKQSGIDQTKNRRKNLPSCEEEKGKKKYS